MACDLFDRHRRTGTAHPKGMPDGSRMPSTAEVKREAVLLLARGSHSPSEFARDEHHPQPTLH